MPVDPDTFEGKSPWWIHPTTGEKVSAIDDAGNFRVVLQDQTTPPLDLYFIQQKGVNTALTNAVAKDDRVATFDSVADMAIGDYIGVFSGPSGPGRFYFGTVLNKVGNDITFDTPFDFEFQPGDPALSSTRNLNVNGSVTPQIFSIQAGQNIVVDITRFVIHMVDNTAMDDTKFGSLTKLTNGLILRKVDGTYQNIFNVKDNGEIANLAPDASYPDKVPAGTFAFRAPYNIAGQRQHGVVIRIGAGESLELIVQDDLSSLDSFRALAQGHQTD
jgi:hypothetical protein